MAKQRSMIQRINHVTNAAVALLSVAGLSVSMTNAACPSSGLLEILLRAVPGALSPVIFETHQFLLPYLLGHMGFLECLLQMATRGWRVFLAFTGAA